MGFDSGRREKIKKWNFLSPGTLGVLSRLLNAQHGLSLTTLIHISDLSPEAPMFSVRSTRTTPGFRRHARSHSSQACIWFLCLGYNPSASLPASFQSNKIQQNRSERVELALFPGRSSNCTAKLEDNAGFPEKYLHILCNEFKAQGSSMLPKSRESVAPACSVDGDGKKQTIQKEQQVSGSE